MTTNPTLRRSSSHPVSSGSDDGPPPKVFSSSRSLELPGRTLVLHTRLADSAQCAKDLARREQRWRALMHAAAERGGVAAAAFELVNSRSVTIVSACPARGPAPPKSGRSGRLTSAVMGLIVVSIVNFVLETLPQFNSPPCAGCEPEPAAAFAAVEGACMGIFMLELAVRVGSVHAADPATWLAEDSPLVERMRTAGALSRTLTFLQQPLNAVDAIVVLNWVVELAAAGMSALAVLRVLRLMRVFRALRCGRLAAGVRLLVDVLRKSLEALLLLVFISGLFTVIVGSLVYYAERGEFRACADVPDAVDADCEPDGGVYLRATVDGAGLEQSPFVSLPSAFYWAITTITTVGYGDVVPTSAPGRALAMMSQLSSIVLLAMPLSIIAANFAEHYAEFTEVSSPSPSPSPAPTSEEVLAAKLAAVEAKLDMLLAMGSAGSSGGESEDGE